MKKLLIICGFIFSCSAANAQWYIPISRESNNSRTQQQPQQQIRKVTAYCLDQSAGGYYKVPIKISVGESIYLIAIYESSAIGARWNEDFGKVTVYQCSGLPYDEFECRFSYKAIILNKTYYFDL